MTDNETPDIVKRLRRHTDVLAIIDRSREAANEIERLRAENERLLALYVDACAERGYVVSRLTVPCMEVRP